MDEEYRLLPASSHQENADQEDGAGTDLLPTVASPPPPLFVFFFFFVNSFFFILRYYKFFYPLFLKNTLRQLILEPSDYLRAETWQSSCRVRVKEHIKLILKIIGD